VNIEQMATDLTATTTRLTAYHAQITKWLAGFDTKDPNTAEARAQVGVLKDKLNKARIALGAVRVQRGAGAALPPATEGRLDLERMLQDLDRTAERLNTYHHRVGAWLSGVGRTDPIRERVTALVERTRVARVAVLAAREAGRAYGPCDYRVDEILY